MICFREDLCGRFEMKIHFKMMKSLSEGNHELWWYRSVIAGRAQGNALLLLKAGRGKRKQAARIRLFLWEKSRYCSLPVHNVDFVWRWALHLPACTLLWESLPVVFCLMGFSERRLRALCGWGVGSAEIPVQRRGVTELGTKQSGFALPWSSRTRFI